MQKLVFKDFQLEHNLDEIGVDNFNKARITLRNSEGKFVYIFSKDLIDKYMAERILKGDEESVRQAIQSYQNSVKYYASQITLVTGIEANLIY